MSYKKTSPARLLPEDGKTQAIPISNSRDWRQIYEEFSKEHDVNKLLELARELCDAIGNRR